MDDISIELVDTFRFIHEPLSQPSTRHRSIGRQQECSDMASRMLLSAGGAFLISGYRGVGKTTFVNQVIDEVNKRKQSMSALTGRIEVIDVALNIARPMQSVELMYHILRGIYNRLLEKGLLDKLRSDLLRDLELAFARTSVSFELKSSEQSEQSSSVSDITSLIPLLNIRSKFSFTSKQSRGSAKALTYLAYDEAAAEYDLIHLTQKLSSRCLFENKLWQRLATRLGITEPLPERLKIVLIFDELDKLEEFEDVNGQSPLNHILANLKNLFTTSGVVFLFVAGKHAHDQWLDDIGRGDSIYESIFAHALYLPTLWGQVDDFCDPMLANAPAVLQGQTRYSRVYQDFKQALTYLGRGIPRRIIRTFNEYVRWHENQLYLQFSPLDLRRIRFFAHLHSVLNRHETVLAGDLRHELFYEKIDQRRLALYYLCDWVLQRGLQRFTWDEAIEALKQLNRMIAPHHSAAPEMVRSLMNTLVEYDYIEGIAQDITDRHNRSSSPYCWQLRKRRLVELGYTSELLLIDERERLQSVSRSLGSERYSLERQIARGGTSTVYKATDHALQQPVAIKLISGLLLNAPNARKLLKNEAFLLGKLSHPNIVDLYSADVERDSPYFVMEYVHGVPLSKLVGEKALNYSDLISITHQTAEAIRYLHDNGVLWGDIKPSNIMITREGDVKILDLGIARVASVSGDVSFTDNLNMGTPQFMSPEQLHAERIDKRSEIYSFGAVLLQLISGQAFERNHYAHLLNATQIDPRQSAFYRMIQRCLQQDPEDRYQDMAELIQDIPKRQSETELENRVTELVEHNSDNVWDLGSPTMPIYAITSDTSTEQAAKENELEKINIVKPSAASVDLPGVDGMEQPDDWRFLDKDITPIQVDDFVKTRHALQKITQSDDVLSTQCVLRYDDTGETNQQDSEKTFVLNKEVYSIGRDRDNDIVLHDSSSSRFHAKLICDSSDGKGVYYQLEDLNSSNGVYLNGDRLAGAERLNHGDRFRIGDSQFQFFRVENEPDGFNSGRSQESLQTTIEH